MVFALNEEGSKVERIFIVPSHKVRIKSMSIGADSKYNKYIEKYDIVDRYKDFLKSL